MKNMAKWMLGAAVLAGGLGMGATTAQAAEFGIYVHGPTAYIPPCPGPGYEWVAGYNAGGYWVPGRWNFRGVRHDYPVARFYGPRDDHRYFRDDHRAWDRGRDGFRR